MGKSHIPHPSRVVAPERLNRGVQSEMLWIPAKSMRHDGPKIATRR
jgi:hypothetical protein